MDRQNGPARPNWFGEKRPVRLLLLAALLTLGVINFSGVCRAALFLWQIAQPLVLGAIIAYVMEIVVQFFERQYFPRLKKPWVASTRRWVCILLAAALVFSFVTLVVCMVIPGLGDAFAVLARELPCISSREGNG